ncbi:MAG: rhomboid family intramembrane serine protease [Myxococcota bacterium]
MAAAEPGSPRVPPTPWATRLLIGLNVLVFMLEMSLTGATALYPGVPATVLIRLGANHAPSVWEGEVWRLLASAFLHGNLVHIALNMYGLNILGRLLEPVLGRLGILGLYAGSAIVGAASSLAFSGGVSVGASGAVFGFVGALLAFTWLARDKPRARVLAESLIYIVVINLALAWFINRSSAGIQIDNYAHVGGLVGGFTLGLGMLGVKRQGAFSPPSLAGHLAYALVVLLVMGQAMHPRDNPAYHASVGFAALESSKLALAERHADTGLVLDPHDPAVLALKVAVCRRQHDDECTWRQLRLLLRLDPLPVQAGVPQANAAELLGALKVLAYECVRAKDWELCAPVYERAVQLVPDDKHMANGYAWSLLQRGGLTPAEKREALDMADRARRLAGGLDGQINHTYAEALHQNGRTDEAIHLLERMLAGELGGVGYAYLFQREEDGEKFDDAFLRKEIERMRREAAGRHKAMAPVP